MKLREAVIALATLSLTGCLSSEELRRLEREEYLRSPAYKCDQMGGIPYTRKTETGAAYYGGCDFPRVSK